MEKYKIVGSEIVDMLKAKKKEGYKTFTITALDIEHKLSVSERCGAKKGSRYLLICQAMNYAGGKFKGKVDRWKMSEFNIYC